MLVRNLLSMSVMRIVSALLTLSLVVFCARLWGVTQLGQLALLTTLFLFCQLLPLMGLHLFLIREVSARPERADVHAPNAAFLAFLVSCVLCLVIGFGGQWLYADQPELHRPIWLIALALLPTAPIIVIEAVLMAQQRMNVVARFNISENMGRTACALVLIFLGSSLSAIFTVFLIGRVLVACAYLHKPDVPRLLRRDGLSKAMLGTYLKKAPVFFSIVLCSSLITRLDMLMLSKLSTPHELGLYAAPYKLYELGLMVPQIVMVVLFPHLSSLFAKNTADLMKLVAATIRYPLLAAWPILLLLALFSSDILRLFGHEATQGAAVLMLLLVALVGTGINQLLATCMLVVNRPDLDLRTLSVGAILTLGLLALCIPLFGSRGAALVVLLMSIISPALRTFWLRPLLPMKMVWLAVRDTSLCALSMALTMALLWSFGALAAALGGLASYALVLRWQGLPRLGELRAYLAGSTTSTQALP